MPRLPIDLSTAGVQDTLPSAVIQPRSATSDDFGGSIGTALQRVGDSGSTLAGKVLAYAEKEQKFDAQTAAVKVGDDNAMGFEQRVRDLKGNAQGFWQSERAIAQKASDDYLAGLPSEDLRKQMAPQMAQLVAARTKQAFIAQYQQSDANTKLTLDEEARKNGLQVNQDPGAYEATVAQAEKVIDASPLTDLEKTRRKAELRNTLAYTAAQASAQQDPAGTVAASVGGGDFRSLVRQRESGKNDSAGSPGGAYGRYQFQSGTWNAVAAKAGVPAVVPGQPDPRLNPDYQEKAMTVLTAQNAAALKSANLPITDANLYMLHFMGSGAGPKFIRAMQADAGATAASMFPKEAAANPSVFYGGKDRVALSLSEVFAKQTRGLNGAGTSPVAAAPTSAQANLTADQTNAVREAATRALVQQQQSAALAAAADQKQALDNTLVQIKEGPNPEATYRAARANGTISGYDNIVKAEGVLDKRNQDGADLATGLSLMAGGRSVANPYDKSHKDGIEAVYTNATTKAGLSPGAAAATIFDRTGMVPASFATAMRGALVSDDASRLTDVLRTASNMIRQNPNAFAGVDGRADIEKAAAEYDRQTVKLGKPEGDAVQSIMADARAPANMDPVKSEVMAKFSKDNLTQEKIESRMSSQFGGWLPFTGATLPPGPQRAALGSIYSQLATDAFSDLRDPDKALARADFQIKQQFGTQNGVITRYPPDKAGLPAIEGQGYKWINQQAAETVKDQLGIVVDPSQIVLMPIERDGVSTSAAFRNGGMTTTRADSKPGQESSLTSVPYQVLVMPKDASGAVQTLNGAYFPDVQDYLAKKNAAIQADAAQPPAVMYDQFGAPHEAPTYAPELAQTTEQVKRRQQAEATEQLRKSAESERMTQQRQNTSIDYATQSGVIPQLVNPSGR